MGRATAFTDKSFLTIMGPLVIDYKQLVFKRDLIFDWFTRHLKATRCIYRAEQHDLLCVVHVPFRFNTV